MARAFLFDENQSRNVQIYNAVEARQVKIFTLSEHKFNSFMNDKDIDIDTY